MTGTIAVWREALADLLAYYDANRGPLILFVPALFIFFVVVNILSYWLAMITAFPYMINWYYFKVQFPVGLFGALFDCLSFFVTVYVVRRAVRTTDSREYIGHLSIDLIIAVLATLWVVYVFTISGWIIKWVEANPSDFAARAQRYEQMVVDAIDNPVDNFRNIYFGLVMGLSAMIPTTVHFAMFLRAAWQQGERSEV
ncbi:MAG: hypothetical protein AAF732_15715 [Pseudomonadota bacterium]